MTTDTAGNDRTERDITTYLERMVRKMKREGKPSWRAGRTRTDIANAVKAHPLHVGIVLHAMLNAGTLAESKTDGVIRYVLTGA